MSKRLKSCSLLALAASGLLLSSAAASAATYYSGGATLPFGLYLRWFQETNGGKPFLGADGVVSADDCNPATTSCFAYAPTGSGAGVTAFVNQQSMNATPSDTPYENFYISYAEGVNGYGTGSEFFDFGGSDAVLTAAQIASYNAATGPRAARGPAIQVPSVGSPVAIPYNTTGLTFPATRVVPAGAKSSVGGSGKLYLSRKAYCGIFTGDITNWGDPILDADNRGTNLSNSAITVVVRQESSGTTFLFSRHLAAVCDGSATAGGYTWVGGVGTTVTWPNSTTKPGSHFVTATGSNGVATTVLATTGAIGYVSADYTAQASSPEISPAPVAANLQTRASAEANQLPASAKPIPPAPTFTLNAIDGFVAPATDTAANWSAALDTATLRNPPNDTTSPVDAANPEAYPIAGFTMLNFYSCYFPAAETTAVRKFITDYTAPAPTVYDTAARNRGFSPLPNAVKLEVRNWATSLGAAGIHTGPISGTCTISSGS